MGTKEIRISVFAVRDDSGNNGVSKQDAEDLMVNVVSKFNEYNIILHPCVREIWDSNRLYHSNNDNRFFSNSCESISLTLYPRSVLSGIVGTAASGTAWSSDELPTIIHEIGHVFGLAHTHQNNDECPSQFCADCDPCDPNCNFEIEEGDGICDTPANTSYVDQNGNIVYPFLWASMCTSATSLNFSGPLPCNETYVDPMSVLARNYMSYFNHPCRSEFTTGQMVRMHNTIDSKLQYAIGAPNSCIETELAGWQNTGNLNDQNLVFSNQTFFFNSSLTIGNSEITFVDCELIFSSDTELVVDNSTLELKGSTVKGSDTSCSTGDFRGIILINQSILEMYDGAFIEARSPIFVANELGSNALILGDDFRLNSKGISALASVGRSTCILKNGLINGGLILQSDEIITGPSYPTNGCLLFNCTVMPANSKQSGIVMSGGGWLSMIESNLTGFTVPISSFDGYSANINNSFINSGSSPLAGINLENLLSVNVNNSHFDKTSLRMDGVSIFSTTQNNFNDCGGIHCQSHIILNADNSMHLFEKNIIDSPINALLSESNIETVFLCNDFDNAPGYNFSWKNVNPIQGFFDYNILETRPAGNLFSSSLDHITGFSTTDVIYYYNDSSIDEEPINNSNSGVEAQSNENSANCGLIGPDWPYPGNCPIPGIDCNEPCPLGIDCSEPCPPGIDCTEPCPPGVLCTNLCPQGINCNEPCPLGIDCTQDCPDGINCIEPCPPGINCTEPCPPGIDCTEPCPPGIDCTEACPPGIICFNPCDGEDPDCFKDCPLGIDCDVLCPPGIDCSKPCPPGIDCTRPCPPGIDCSGPCPPGVNCGGTVFESSGLVLDPSEDGVLQLLENQYQMIMAEIQTLENSLFYESSNALQGNEFETLQTLSGKPKVIEVIRNKNLQTNLPQISLCFKNSNIYLESEMVEILLSNPKLLLHNKINPIVFSSNSFSSSNLKTLSNAFQNIDENDINQFAQLNNFKRNKTKIIQFALNRMYSYADLGHNQQILWMSRLNNLSSKLHIAELIFKRGEFTNLSNHFSDLINNAQYNTDEINDILQYQTLLNILKNANTQGETYFTLSEEIKLEILGVANSSHRFSSSKARGILNAYCDYNLEGINNDQSLTALDFYSNDDLLISDFVEVYPNPASESITVRNLENETIKCVLTDSNGKVFKEFYVNQNQRLTVDVKLFVPGIYFLQSSVPGVGSRIKYEKILIVE